MNGGDPTDQATEYLIKATIHTSPLYVWLGNYKFLIFVTYIFVFLYPESKSHHPSDWKAQKK